MPAALAVEGFIGLAGLYLFLSGASLSPAKKFWLAALSMLTVVFSVVGMTIAPPPPSIVAMAASSLVTIILVCGLTFWLGRS